MNYTTNQLEQLAKKEITTQQVDAQLERFCKGFPQITLVSAATIGDGITALTEEQKKEYVALYEGQAAALEIIKFVPASGAATRMFKFLHEFLRDFNREQDSLNAYINRHHAKELFTFTVALKKFPFYGKITSSLKAKHANWIELTNLEKKTLFIEEMLLETGFNYGALPKGLVPFHKYKSHAATAFEEHLFEGANYAQSNGVATLHFTISPDSKTKFLAELDRVIDLVQQKTGVRFNVDFSHQSENTDTVAVDLANNPVLQEDGTFNFRPAGHGALLTNLNALDAHVIFIKNIDNVTVCTIEQQVSFYKKMLAGHLLSLQQTMFSFLRVIEDGGCTAQKQQEIELFLKTKLFCKFPKDYSKFALSYQLEFLFNKLNRPLRVCGMVKNEGEPGGGPFWINNSSGDTCLGIIEGAQVDESNPEQVKLFKEGTHFNPVDIVCGVRDYKGNKFDLTQFSDSETGFITYKSYMGKPIKALELPGLWNGGMAYWNSVFVEVPIITFNPVKTVNDLLKPAHQL